jgi:hypothetical protein
VADILFFQRQPVIGHIRLAGGVHEDVARLDIPMHESSAMGIVQCLGNGYDEFRRFDA